MTGHKYRIVKYPTQKSESIGVSAGMWAVVETREQIVGFADTEAQATDILRAFASPTPAQDGAKG